MNITMIGAGYVGLVTGACFAELGHHVVCVDVVEDKITLLKGGEIPIFEPGLDALIAKVTAEGRLSFTTSLEESVPGANAIFIAVGTPTSRRGDGYADLSYVHAASKNIAKYLKGYTVIVDKSTVPAGTARQVLRIIKSENPDANFDMVSNPEFLREGAAIEDFMRPDRIVVGAESEEAFGVMREIYNPLYLRDTPIVETTLETAELIKYAANAFLATKISFINEMANLCEYMSADVLALAKGIGMDGRIGNKFLHPGPGYGGSCFPKDTLALLRIAQECGGNLRVVSAAVEANNAQKALMVKKVKNAVNDSIEGKTFAVLGLTFKPDTDDMRDSASLTIIPTLVEKGAIVRVHDPKGMEEAQDILSDEIYYASSAYDAATGADCVILMTEWNQYRALDFDKLKDLMNDNPVFVDLRNVYRTEKMEKLGFNYVGNGQL